MKARFDDERLRTESLIGTGGARAFFSDIDASELCRADTFTIEGPSTTLIFDTAQLLRMFPTEKAFCDGEKPKSN